VHVWPLMQVHSGQGIQSARLAIDASPALFQRRWAHHLELPEIDAELLCLCASLAVGTPAQTILSTLASKSDILKAESLNGQVRSETTTVRQTSNLCERAASGEHSNLILRVEMGAFQAIDMARLACDTRAMLCQWRGPHDRERADINHKRILRGTIETG